MNNGPEVMVELIFDDQAGCELRASVNDHVLYAHYYANDDLVRLAEDIEAMPNHPTQADFEGREGNEVDKLGYRHGIYRDDDCPILQDVCLLTELLADVPTGPNREHALLHRLLWRAAGVQLAATMDIEKLVEMVELMEERD